VMQKKSNAGNDRLHMINLIRGAPGKEKRVRLVNLIQL
jgi:hypothetical protein